MDSEAADARSSALPPAIAPAPAEGAARPLVSVMVPAYEPDERLVQALRSVLTQDSGVHRMQIAVVDDASRTADIDALVGRTGAAARIELHRSPHNRGIAANWNECIRLARGQLVHILHQDDRVEAEFYARLSPAFGDPEIGMAFCRHAFLDDADRVTGRSHRERWTPGILRDWLARIAEGQRIQCASAIVRRAAYERLGGYRQDLAYALDWEMWVRIAARYRVWYEPAMLAYYRRHEGNETARLRRENIIARDVYKAIGLISAHLPDAQREGVLSTAYARFARRMLRQLESRAEASAPLHQEVELVRAAVDRMTRAPLAAFRYRRRAARLRGA